MGMEELCEGRDLRMWVVEMKASDGAENEKGKLGNGKRK